MKKFILLSSFLTLFIFVATAQKLLKQTIILNMPEDGNNGASVAWNPIQKKYYAAYAGNASYAMGVFDATGKSLQDDLITDFDMRGIWYNSTSKRIEFNCYSDAGIGHLELETNGQVANKTIDLEGKNQPDDQSVGVYVANNTIAYLSPTYYIEKYNAKTGLSTNSSTKLHVGCKTKDDVSKMETEDMEATKWDSRNYSVVQYTGMPKSEWAILNVTERKIELYDQQTGLQNKTYYAIPKEITLEMNFNFSYANGIWWFFNKKEKKWYGCLVSNLMAANPSVEAKIIPSFKNSTNIKNNIKNNIVLNNDGFTIKSAGLYFDDNTAVPATNKVDLNQNVNLILELDGGWKLEDGMAYIGATERITLSDGYEVLKSEDLFKSYETTGVKETDANYITIKAVITKMDNKKKYVNVNFKVWDKKGGNTISGNYKLYIN